MATRETHVLMCSMAVPWPDKPLLGVFHTYQAHALRRLGHKMTLFSPAPRLPRFLRPFSKRLARQMDRPEDYEIHDVRVLSPRVNFAFPPFIRERVAAVAPWLVDLMCCWAVEKALDRAIREVQPTALVAHGMIPWRRVVIRAGRRHHLPVVFAEHSARDVLRIRPGTPLARHYDQGASQASASLVVGPQMLRHAEELGWRNTQLHLNGVTAQPPQKPVADLEGFHILTAANYYTRKGFEAVIDAFGKICRTHDDVHLHLVTDPPTKVLKRIAASPAAARIHVHGRMAPHHLRHLMSWCDLFVLPSAEEAFGLVYGESLAAGTPIVLSECAGFADYLRTTQAPHETFAKFVTPRDPDSLAKKLHEVLLDPEWLLRARHSGREFAVENLSWQHNATDLLEVLDHAEPV